MKLRLTFAIAASALLARTFAQAPEASPKDAPNRASPFEAFHKAYTEWFVSQPGNGLSRISGKGRAPEIAFSRGDEKAYLLEDVQLISLIKHDPPVAYLDGSRMRHETMRENSVQLSLQKTPEVALSKAIPVTSRDLSEFEKSALLKLKQGQNIVQDGDEKMLGAIRTRESCTTCHDVEKGALLGAFSYTFVKAAASK